MNVFYIQVYIIAGWRKIETMRLVKNDHKPVDVVPSQVTPLSVVRIFSVNCCTFATEVAISIYTLRLVVEGSNPALPRKFSVGVARDF